MSSKLNISGILNAHWKSLRVKGMDGFSFILLPIIIGGLISFFIKFNDTEAAKTLTIFFSVFIPLSITCILSALTFVKPEKENGTSEKDYNILLTQVIENLCYVVLISIFELIIMILCVLFFKIELNYYLALIINTLIIAGVVHVFFSVIMIMKRLFAVFNEEIEYNQLPPKED